MSKQLTFAENDPVTGSPTLDGFTGLDDQRQDGVVTAENDEPGYSFGGRATFDGGALSPATIQCVKVLGQNVLFASFVVRLDLSFDNDDLIIVCLRPAFANQTHDASTYRFDIFPVWNGVGADLASATDPSLPKNEPPPELPVQPGHDLSSTWQVRPNQPPRHVDVYRGIANSIGGAGPYWSTPTNALPGGVGVKVRSWVPLAAGGSGSAPGTSWSVELQLPLDIGFSPADMMQLEPSFGIYVNMVRIGTGSSPLVGNYEHNTQFIWPDASATVHDVLGVNTRIDPASYGEGYIPSLDSPPGNRTALGVRFAGQATFEGWDGVGARLKSAAPLTAPTDAVDPTADNVLVAQVKNTGSTGADDVTADFHFANWGLGPGVSGPGTAFPLWGPANGAAVPTAKTTIPAGGGIVELTGDWLQADIPPELKNTHQCVWVELTSDKAVQFVQSSVRRNMNFVHLSQLQRTAEISGKGYTPPAAGSTHPFALVAQARRHVVYDDTGGGNGNGGGDDNGGVLGLAAAAAQNESPPMTAVVWEWLVSGFLQTPQSLTIGGTSYPTWLPAPGAFGYIASHDDAEHDFGSDLLAPGMRRIDRGVYELAVPHNGSVAVTTVVQAAPASEPPPLLKLGDHGDAVARAQFLLAVEGYGISPTAIDGVFGAHTQRVVQAFQRAAGLTADGVIGPLTWAPLLAGDPVQTDPFPSPLQSGATGDRVIRLQNTLNGTRDWFAHGAKPLAVDGVFGAQTTALTRAAQTWGAVKPDGIVGYATWAISTGPTLWEIAGPHTPKAPVPALPVVRQGDHGDGVQRVQFLLADVGMGLAASAIDGVFGPATRQAVLRFQQLNHLTQDGVVGAKTSKALLGAAHVHPNPLPPTVSPGAKGVVVSRLQTALNQSRWRFDAAAGPVAVDGDYGAKTTAAVKAFQTWGLVIVDGITGPRTWAVAAGPSLWAQ